MNLRNFLFHSLSIRKLYNIKFVLFHGTDDKSRIVYLVHAYCICISIMCVYIYNTQSGKKYDPSYDIHVENDP